MHIHEKKTGTRRTKVAPVNCIPWQLSIVPPGISTPCRLCPLLVNHAGLTCLFGRWQQAVIDGLPLRDFNNGMSETGTSCAICCGQFCHGDTVAALPCGHVYHKYAASSLTILVLMGSCWQGLRGTMVTARMHLPRVSGGSPA